MIANTTEIWNQNNVTSRAGFNVWFSTPGGLNGWPGGPIVLAPTSLVTSFYSINNGRSGYNQWTVTDLTFLPDVPPVLNFAGVQTLVGTGLASPGQVATDRAGNVYIADTGNGQV